MIHTYLFGRYQVVLHADELPDQEQVDNLEDAVARRLPHLQHLRGRDFTSPTGLTPSLPACRRGWTRNRRRDCPGYRFSERAMTRR
jgi:hypothetical protein